MQLIGDHQAEDRSLISEVVLAKMNQAPTVRSSSASRSPARSPQGQKPTTVQPQQVKAPSNPTESVELCWITFFLKKNLFFISLSVSEFFSCHLAPSQSAAHKEGLADPNRTSGQRPQPQGSLNMVFLCKTSAASVA